jgi:hypothetical protein
MPPASFPSVTAIQGLLAARLLYFQEVGDWASTAGCLEPAFDWPGFLPADQPLSQQTPHWVCSARSMRQGNSRRSLLFADTGRHNSRWHRTVGALKHQEVSRDGSTHFGLVVLSIMVCCMVVYHQCLAIRTCIAHRPVWPMLKAVMEIANQTHNIPVLHHLRNISQAANLKNSVDTTITMAFATTFPASLLIQRSAATSQSV